MTTEQKQYTHHKDFVSHKVEINGVDISGIVIEFEIYQDIFTPYWSASMLIIDNNNAMMFNEFTQGDIVNIEIESNPKLEPSKHTFKFILYKIGERALLKQQEYGYHMMMVDESFFKDQKQRISKAFDKRTADQAISEILPKIGGIGEITKTKEPFSWIVPNLSPMAAAQWIARWAVKDGADMLLYQQNDKQWSWKSFDEMLSPKSKSSKLPLLVQRPANLRDGESELPEYQYAMEQYKFVNHMDLMLNVATGAISSTALYHDLKSRKAGLSTFEYGQDIKEDASKKPYKNVSDIANSSISYQPLHPENFGEGGKVINENYQKWRGSRKSNLLKLETNRLLASIPGRIDIYDQLGKMIDVELPSQQDKELDTLYDTHYKNRYALMAMRHIWTPKSFTTILELGKKRLA